MDDDPEPNHNPVIFDHTGELQKCSLESSDETSTNQESGDNGPFLEPQESAKKAFAGKEAPDQPSDLPGSLKNSTPLRKASRRSIQRLPGPESRRSGQQPAGQQLPLSQKSSRSQSISETDAKDVTWVSKRTGKIMKCRSQQTSLIWEGKFLSRNNSTEDSDRSKEGTNTEEEFTSSGEMATAEECSGQDISRGCQTREGKVYRRSGQQQESRRSSQRSYNEPPLLLPRGMDIKEEICWISQKTGKEMKNKAQQTSIIWELKTLSEILRSSSQESLCNALETDMAEMEDTHVSSGETEAEPLALRESQGSIQQPEEPPAPEGQESRRSSQKAGAKTPRRNTQQATELEAELEGQRSADKFEQALKTGSEESLRRELVDLGEQVDTPRRSKSGSVCQLPDSRRSSQKAGAKTPRRNTQQATELEAELEGQRSADKFDQAQQMGSEESLRRELVDLGEQVDAPRRSKSGSVGQLPDSRRSSQAAGSPRRSQHAVVPDSGAGVENAAKAPTGFESEQIKSPRKPLSTTELQGRRGTAPSEQNTWISRKTGKVVKNQEQQTDRSWLQYYAAKMRKVKKCSSQQTDESFLQSYLGSKKKRSSTDTLLGLDAREEGQSDTLSSAHDEGLSRTPPVSMLGLYSLKSYAVLAETEVEDDEEASLLRPAEEDVAGSRAPRPEEPESRPSMGGRSAEEEGGGTAQQSYSVISMDDGIWMNRRTGKLLVSHSQQTSRTSLLGTGSATGLSKASGAAEPPGRGEEQAEGEAAPPEREAGGRPSLQQETRPGGQPSPGSDGSQSSDDMEQLLSSRLSEAMLLSLEAPDAEDGPAQVYSSLDGGNWVNVQTGTLLATQSQQTEEGFAWGPSAEGQPPEDPCQPPPGDEPAEILEPGDEPTRQPGGEGMDDDPLSHTSKLSLAVL